MNEIKDYQIIIQEELNNINLIKEPSELYKPIAYGLASGGKNLRPMLVLLSCELFGGSIKDALFPALAVEILHNFTLVHDDIMDNAPIRRGQPTVYKKWDANTAILSGDAMMMKAYEYLAKGDHKCFKEIFNVFNDTALQICEGQQYDMNFEKTENVSIADYLKMIELKTSVLLAASLKIGAIIANAKDDDLNKIYEFGKNIGLAFQLQDDLLDVFGDEKKFGKKLGGDIILNKKTFLLIRSFELASGETLNELKHWTSLKEFNNEEKIQAITNIYKKLQIKEETISLINKYFKKGLDSYEEINVAQKKDKLRAYVNRLMVRDF